MCYFLILSWTLSFFLSFPFFVLLSDFCWCCISISLPRYDEVISQGNCFAVMLQNACVHVRVLERETEIIVNKHCSSWTSYFVIYGLFFIVLFFLFFLFYYLYLLSNFIILALFLFYTYIYCHNCFLPFLQPLFKQRKSLPTRCTFTYSCI